jgi:hypothetical protein
VIDEDLHPKVEYKLFDKGIVLTHLCVLPYLNHTDLISEFLVQRKSARLPLFLQKAVTVVLGRDMLTSDVEASVEEHVDVQRDVGAEKGRVLPRLAGKHAFAALLLRGKQTARPKRVVFVRYIPQYSLNKSIRLDKYDYYSFRVIWNCGSARDLDEPGALISSTHTI